MKPKPYYADEAVTLYCGDFRDLLPDVLAEHGEPDLVCVDPPYGETSLAWDTWPVGWPAMMPGRSMWCFGSMRMFLDRRHEFDGWKLSQDVVWEKQDGTGFATDRLRRVHEHALHFYRGDWGSIHHETPRTEAQRGPDKSVRRTGEDRTAHTGSIGPSVYTDDGRRLLRSVIKSPNMRGTAINETEKPAGLVENLITYGAPPLGSSSGCVRGRLLHVGRRPELRSSRCGD